MSVNLWTTTSVLNALTFWSVLALQMQICAQQPVQNTKHYFVELPFDATHTFLQANQKGTLLAVVKGGQLQGTNYSGTSLEIWSLDSTLKLQKIVFSDNRKVPFSPQVRWVGDDLLYSSIEGISLPNFLEQLPQEPIKTAVHVKGHIWRSRTRRVENFSPARDLFTVPVSELRQVIVVNPVDEVLQSVEAQRVYKPQRGGSTPSIKSGVPICIYSTVDGKRLRRIVAQIRPPRTPGDSDFIPVSASANGKALLALAYTDDPWRRVGSPLLPYNFLVSIDLTTGSVTRLSSQDEPDTVWVTDRRFFGVGIPIGVNSSLVACALDATERNLSYRFQYFNTAGTLVKDSKANDRVLRKAHLPRGALPVSWDDNGNALLQTSQDIWLFNTSSQASQKLAEGLVVTDVCGRSKGSAFLVRIQRVTKINPAIGSARRSQKMVQPSAWGFIKTK